MKNSDELALFFSTQLPALLIENPTLKFIGLKINKEDNKTALHCIYIEKEEGPDPLPFKAFITVTEWNGKSEKEEFFLEVITAERLIEKLQRFDEIGSFVFFEAPSSVTKDSLNMYPQALFCKLFPELGEYNPYVPALQLLELEASSVNLLTSLETRLKHV